MQRLDVLNATTPLCNDVIDNRTRMHATWNVLYAPRLFLLQTFKTRKAPGILHDSLSNRPFIRFMHSVIKRGLSKLIYNIHTFILTSITFRVA